MTEHTEYKRPAGLVVAHAISSMLIYPLCYYVIRYRRKVVRQNLRMCFPYYTEEQRRDTERRFYKHFADMIVETLYGRHITAEVMKHHLVTENLDEVMAETKQYQGSLVALGHFFNWEWIADYGNQFAEYGVTAGGVYKKLTSPFFNKMTLKIREKRGGLLIEHLQLLRTMVRQKKEGQPTCYAMISDQRPEGHSAYQDVTLLGQPTKMLTGTESLGVRFGFPIYYASINSPKRGFYTVRLEKLYDPEADKDLPAGTITERFTRRLEANIQASPSSWLWTHNRFWADPVFEQKDNHK